MCYLNIGMMSCIFALTSYCTKSYSNTMDNTNTTSKTTTKLFAGFLLSSELKMHLNSSTEWKSLAVTPENSQDFQVIQYDDKKFVGHYLPEEKLTLNEIKTHELEMTQKLLSYCPKLIGKHLKFSLLSQLFIH